MVDKVTERVRGRRRFLAASAGALGITPMLQSLGPLNAAETELTGGIAQFSSEIEPLVRFLESTPRERIIEETARRVRGGVSYRQLLAALLLAGVRNVQPRPSVGFKFHAVLVVNSAHLASISGADEDRWLPIFWAIDNFKGSQARDVREGNWTLAPVDESAVPPPHLAAKKLRDALDRWDESAADVAVTSMVRSHGANDVFELLSEYAARDFRSIGHKVIYLSNGFRTLRTIGWEYAEPVMRSLVYAMLNHHNEPNPADSDLAADRPGRRNRELINRIDPHWRAGNQDDDATRDLIHSLHECSPDEAGEKVVELLNKNVALQSIWDGIFASAAELMMRQRGIVALHAVTTTNAIHHAFRACHDDSTRKFLLLQNASFLTMFRDALHTRGKVADRRIDDLQAEDDSDELTISDIFQTMGNNRVQAAQQMINHLSSGGDPQSVVDHARRLVFLKGNDSHDYKFSSAALEDYRSLSTPWRQRFLAAATFQLRSETEPDRPLVKEITDALMS